MPGFDILRPMLPTIRYLSNMESAWDSFIDKSSNGNLFHRRRFLNYHSAGHIEDASFVLGTNDHWQALFPACIRNNCLISHGGASYGGPVFGERPSYTLVSETVASVIAFATNAGLKKITITLSPKFYSKTPHDYLDFALLKAGFHYEKRELSNAGGPIQADFFENFINKARGAFRKSQRSGVTVSHTHKPSENELEAFYSILAINREQLGTGITHSFEDIKRLFALLPGELELYLAACDGENIASGLVFKCNSQADLIFYVAHLKEHNSLKPIHALVHAMYKNALERNIPWLDYGTSTLNGELTNSGDLLRFKENFNMPGYFRDTFSLQL